MQATITTIPEIDRVLLRFMRVSDDAKLSQILSSLLPDLIKVHLEADLDNADNTNSKVKSLQELMDHLKARVENSRGKVTVPVPQLLGILSSQEFLKAKNQFLKLKTTELVHQFVGFTLQYASDKIDPLLLTQEVCQSFRVETLPILHKIRLLSMMVWYYLQRGADIKPIVELFDSKPDLKPLFLQMVTIYTIAEVACPYQVWKSALKPLFTQSILAYHSPESKLTQVQHQQRFEEFLLVTCLQSTLLFRPCEVLGTMIIATQDQQSCSVGVRYACDSWVRNLTLDLNDLDLERVLYALVKGEYTAGLYSDCVKNLDQMIDKPSDNALKHFIGWIMRLETRTDTQKKIEVINICLFQRKDPSMHKQGLMFTRQLIREDPDLNEQSAVILNQTLSEVQGSSEFDEANRALALLMTAELGAKFFDKVLGQSIDVALYAFEGLKMRIAEIRGKLPIREDDLALTYMEAMNKLRDCYETSLKDQELRDQLTAKIVHYLHSAEASDAHNSELLYILYLYIARLSKDKLTAPLLLHSVNLKDHVDIKIRKEALGQLEKFETSQDQSNLLGPFLDEIRHLFLSLQNPLLSFFVEHNSQPKKALSYDGNLVQYVDVQLIDKIMELSRYALKFYLKDRTNQEQIERLLMLNLNLNFTQVKSNFIKPLKMIKSYVMKTHGIGAGIIVCAESAQFISSMGTNTTSFDQRTLAHKLLFIIFKRHKGLYQATEQSKFDQIAKTHEQRMLYLFQLSLRVYFADCQEQDKFVSLLNEVTESKTVSPNTLEEQKLLANCLAQIQYLPAYRPALVVMLANVANRQLDPQYKCKIVKCLPKIYEASESNDLYALTTDCLESMRDFDQTQVQTAIGKCFAQLWHATNILLDKTAEVMKLTLDPGLELNSKRNLVIYLYEVVSKYGEQSPEMREKLFVELQGVFTRFLFDRRGFMQDLASKGLSLLYRLGDEAQRGLLVASLSDMFSGAGSTKKEKDDQQELLIDFSSSTSNEQREKLKTYKDLVRVADELGQRDMIYQFLEVHRHNQAQQDMKNAAQGISSLLMLDDKIRGSLVKIAPKILMLTYDSNPEVADTMKQLWSSLIPASEEQAFVSCRWDEIFTSCVEGIKSDQWRQKQSASLCLSDLFQAQTRKWSDVSKEFRIVFLISLRMLSDVKDSVKQASYKLVKAIRSFTLKFSNMYSNTDLAQLQEVIDTTIPILLDDCLPSTIKNVRPFGLHMLAELIKSTQSQNLAEKLKIKNKYERQIVLNGNSRESMQKLLCQKQYLQRIIMEMILNVSSIQDKPNQQINYAQQLQADGKLKIDEQELANIAMKYSRESIQGEILKICRFLMNQETFDAVLKDLTQLIQKSNLDTMTKQTALRFLQETVLEQTSLVTPQHSRTIAQKIVQVYALQTPQACLSLKDPVVSSYAACFGLQFKLMRDFPNTIKGLIKSLFELPSEIVYIKCLHYFELSKYLSASMLRDEEYTLHFLPLLFVNKFNNQDMKLKKLSQKAWEAIAYEMQEVDTSKTEGADPESTAKVSMAPYILQKLMTCFDSSAYADRIAASQALSEIIKYSKDEDLVKQVSEKLVDVITGKYFIGKEQIVKSFTQMMRAEMIEVNRLQYLEKTLPQVRSKNLDIAYRNCVLKSLSESMPQNPSEELFEVLSVQLEEALKEIVDTSQTSLLKESQGQFFDLDEKKEAEKENLDLIFNIYDLMPKLVKTDERAHLVLDQMSISFYGKTIWMVRRAILRCYVQLEKIKAFGEHLLRQVADCGEKYDQNLSLVSDLAYRTLKSYDDASRPADLKTAALKIVELLQQRESEDLRRNTDVIRQLVQ